MNVEITAREAKLNQQIAKVKTNLAKYSHVRVWHKSLLERVAPYYKGRLEKFKLDMYSQICLERYQQELKEIQSQKEKKSVFNPETDPLHRENFSQQVNEPMWMGIMGADIFSRPSFLTHMERMHAEQEVADVLNEHIAEEPLQLGIAIVEHSAADPLFGEILAETTEEAQIEVKYTTNIEVYDDDKYLGSLFGKDQVSTPEFETVEALPSGLVKTELDSHKLIKTKKICERPFRIEDEAEFPISKLQFPHIIRKIEEHLSCREKFNFRVSFQNVNWDEEQRHEEINIQPTYDFRKPHHKEKVSIRKCICTTKIFNNVKWLHEQSQLARTIFNKHVRIRPHRGISVRADLHRKKVKHHEIFQLTGAVHTTHYHIDAKHGRFYAGKNVKVEYVQQLTTDEVPPISCGLKHYKFESRHIDSEWWNTLSW